MKIDAQLGALYPHLAAGMAKRMEAMGFDAVWSFEAGHDPFLPLVAAAMSNSGWLANRSSSPKNILFRCCGAPPLP